VEFDWIAADRRTARTGGRLTISASDRVDDPRRFTAGPPASRSIGVEAIDQGDATMRSIITGAVAFLGAAALTACADSGSTPDAAPSSNVAAAPAPATTSAITPDAPATTDAGPAPTRTTAAPTAATRTPTRASTPTSDVSQLRRVGITLDKGVLIDVADDGVDRYLAIGKNGVVDFTGTTSTDSTTMALKAAPSSQPNRVVIKPPFYNEDLGAGSCVADTSGAALKLETCVAGKSAQIFTVVPGGDSGQFELHGQFGVIRVDGGKITTGGSGRVGLQTIRIGQ
jgi:hypothetical protein